MSALPRPAPLARLTTALRSLPALLRAPVVLDPARVIHTARLVLRPLTAGDRDAFLTLLAESREHLARHFPLHRPGDSDEQTFERQLAFARAADAAATPPPLAWRRVVCLHDGSLIGAVNLNDITRGGGARAAAELNLWLAAACTGQGYATEAVGALLDRAFESTPRGLSLTRVWAYVAPDNTPSLRLLERVGFSRDRRALPVQLNLAGAWTLHHTYQRLAAVPASPITPTPARSLHLVPC